MALPVAREGVGAGVTDLGVLDRECTWRARTGPVSAMSGSHESRGAGPLGLARCGVVSGIWFARV